MPHTAAQRSTPVSRTQWTTALAFCLLALWLPTAGGAAVQDEGGAEEAAAARAEAEREPYTNTVRWATASESDIFGYHVYRGASEEGPFERLTDDPIPGAGNTDETNHYEFVDDTIDPHRAYYYYVETVSMGGEQSRFTPIIRAEPKLPADEADENGENDKTDPDR